MSSNAPLPDPQDESGMSRRGLIRNAAGVGAAGLAAGVLINTATGSAAAAEPQNTPAHSPEQAAPQTGETLIVHVRDTRTGDLDVFHGDQHRSVTDRELAAALLRAAG